MSDTNDTNNDIPDTAAPGAHAASAEQINTVTLSNGEVFSAPAPRRYEDMPAPAAAEAASAPFRFGRGPAQPIDQIPEKFDGHHDILHRLAHGVTNEADRQALEAHVPGYYDAYIDYRNSAIGAFKFRSKASWGQHDAVYGAGSAARLVAAMDARHGSPEHVTEHDAIFGPGSWTRNQAEHAERQQRRQQNVASIMDNVIGPLVRGAR